VTTIALVIPSYARPEQLARALASAERQSRRFDEIVVAVRGDDHATIGALTSLPVRVVTVDDPGVLAAMTAGALATTSDVVAFTDDDAELAEHWAQFVIDVMERPGNDDVGGIGGRDVIYDGDHARPTELTGRVGEVTYWGRLIGNHHCGSANNREVVVLKGVNCAYRRRALGLPHGLLGAGAQAHFEVAVGRHALDGGWRLLYFSELTVIHRPADRRGDDQRASPSDEAVFNSAFNLMRGLPRRVQSRRWLYVHLIGDRATPGVIRCLYALMRRDRATLARRAPSWRASTAAWRVRATPLEFTTLS